MTVLRRALALCYICALVACAGPPAPPSLTAAERSGIADTVRAAIHAFVAAQGPSYCADASRFFSMFSRIDGTTLYAHDTTVVTITQATWESDVRKAFCALRSLDAHVDTVVVQVLHRDVAIAAWVFDETTADSLGTAQHIKGSVLQSWIRTTDGWKTTAGMDAHVKLPAK